MVDLMLCSKWRARRRLWGGAQGPQHMVAGGMPVRDVPQAAFAAKKGPKSAKKWLLGADVTIKMLHSIVEIHSCRQGKAEV